MIPLATVLTEKARANLAQEHTADILNAAFEIEGDPERPDDEGAMRRNVRVEDAFTRDIPWLSGELDSIRKICERYNEDFDRPATTMLRAALLAKRYEIEEIREWNPARPLLSLVTPMVGIWAIAWMVRLGPAETVGHDDPLMGDTAIRENPEFSFKEYLNDGAMDAVTLGKVRSRIRIINTMMKQITDRLVKEGSQSAGSPDAPSHHGNGTDAFRNSHLP